MALQVAHKNPVSRERAATLGLSVACVVAFSVIGMFDIVGHLVDPTAATNNVTSAIRIGSCFPRLLAKICREGVSFSSPQNFAFSQAKRNEMGLNISFRFVSFCEIMWYRISFRFVFRNPLPGYYIYWYQYYSSLSPCNSTNQKVIKIKPVHGPL